MPPWIIDMAAIFSCWYSFISSRYRAASFSAMALYRAISSLDTVFHRLAISWLRSRKEILPWGFLRLDRDDRALVVVATDLASSGAMARALLVDVAAAASVVPVDDDVTAVAETETPAPEAFKGAERVWHVHILRFREGWWSLASLPVDDEGDAFAASTFLGQPLLVCDEDLV